MVVFQLFNIWRKCLCVCQCVCGGDSLCPAGLVGSFREELIVADPTTSVN